MNLTDLTQPTGQPQPSGAPSGRHIKYLTSSQIMLKILFKV